MRTLMQNSIIKKLLIVFITIIILSCFIMPKQVHAADFLTKLGKDLASAFFQFLTFVADLFLQIMQYMMIGGWEIEDINGKSEILYSPGIIFLDKVAGLKINFIDANPGDATKYNENIKQLQEYSDLSGILNAVVNNGYNKVCQGEFKYYATKGYFSLGMYTYSNEKEPYEKTGESDFDRFGGYDYVNRGTIHPNGYLYFISNPDGDWYKNELNIWEDHYVQYREDETGKDANGNIIFDNFVGGGKKTTITEGTKFPYNATFSIDENYLIVKYNYVVDFNSTTNGYEYAIWKYIDIYDLSSMGNIVTVTQRESTAYQLQSTIATWYNALRTIALVGLLSVLVYIGIRIILSSTSAQDKAKYKNMLKDWVVAICILFMLHYIMAFMLNITSSLTEIIQSNVADTTLDENTYDKLMSTVRDRATSGLLSVGSSVTKQFGYVVMYLALVILTGVFTFQYLKRVVFMAFLTMIAPMIALTYPIDKVKDGKAQAFSFWLREYIFNCLIQPVHLLIYTVLISSAFSFAQENILYAIAALAFMVPAEKFIKEMFGMKSQSPTGQLGAAAGGAMVMSMLNKIKSKPPKDDAGSGASGSPNSIRNSAGTGTTGGDTGTGVMDKNNLLVNPPQTKAGKNGAFQKLAQTPAGQAVGRGTERVIKNQANMLKSVGKWSGKTLKSIPGAALGATVGLAATVASGGEKAGAFIGGGAMAGAALSQNLTNSTFNGVGTEIQKGWYGEEGYKTRQAKKEFFGSDEWRKIKEDKTINQTNIRQRVENLIDNGITDGSEMKELLQAGITGEGAKAYKDAGVTNAKEMREFASNGIDGEKLRAIKLATGETDFKKMLRYNAIANAAKSKNKTDPVEFKNWAKTTYKMDEEDADKLLNQCKHYW